VALPLVGGEFVNLTFDSPDLTGSLTPIIPQFPRGPFRGETSRLLQGWTLTAGGMDTSFSSYTPSGQPPGYGEFVDLQEVPRDQWSNEGGRIYLMINSGSLPLGPEVRLSQTAVVPEGVGGLHIFAPGLLDVRINGQPVVDPLLGRLADPVINISAYAGRETSFEFVFSRGFSGAFDILGLTQIPEPSTWALMAIGTVVLAGAVRSRRRSH